MKRQQKKLLGFIFMFIFLSNIYYLNNITFLSNDRDDDSSIEEKQIHLGGHPLKESLVFGTGSGPIDLDPLNAWDSSSYDVIRQVVEGLYMLDYSDPDLPRIPILAVDDGTWINSKCWEVSLRQNVFFHDGTRFKASAVKWNFDRMAYFMNATGTLPISHPIMGTSSLYQLGDGKPIINRTEVRGEYKIRFYLNGEFSPLLDLLTCPSGYIVSPASTPRWDYISTATGDIVGTGPYIYDYYTADTVVQYHAWDQYWRGPAQIENLTFSILEDESVRNNAMLSGTIDILQGETESLLPTFRADPNITVDDTGAGASYFYLGMNNERINATWREAISYAINYTYIIEELMEDTASRAYSPLSPAFLPGWDQLSELDTPIFNVTKAREVLQAAGIGVELITDGDWQTSTL